MSILVVDDERPAAEYLALLLQGEGFETQTAANGVEALVALEAAGFDLALVDLSMPLMNGLDLLAHVRQRWSEMPVIVVTAAADVSHILEAVQLGAVNYLVKPASPPVVMAAVRKALAVASAAHSPDRGVPEIVGASRAMVEVRHLVMLAARSDVHVLITGGTGTGKELVARAIHRHSGRATGPFVAHNCALAPSDLFESEFFGHRRGAFTGADRDHAGLLAAADGGLLFLDELEAMASSHQAKLLRVVDDGEVRPVGSDRVRTVSVRFLGATNRDPREMIRAGALREDLYFRLRGFEIHLPPLRDRPEDIPLLATHFLGGGVTGFTPEALDALTRATWPGNVRQLRNAVQMACSAAGDGPIGPRHLSLECTGAEPRPKPGSGGSPLGGATLRELECRAICEALRECGGNRSRAARLLGIDRSTLRRKLRDLDPDWVAEAEDGPIVLEGAPVRSPPPRPVRVTRRY